MLASARRSKHARYSICRFHEWLFLFYLQPTSSTLSGLRRCRALYDCEADNEDELSFREGEVIIVTNEQTDDDNWMEGALERAPERRGMFPISFVHMLQD